ncbi:kinesin-like protein KIF23 [Anoplophora glabripennis]|uniref:kinesin-like protein KIF23 n=1 Tax=Anoplophora glabripennis TaxID=217634 RepID=UPI000873E9A3|nr:kinesin-like protein KIF23 [Anoplophora glabripennis]
MFAATKFTPTPRKLRREKTTLSTGSDSEKEPVHVYCRLRPLPENLEAASCVKLISPQELCLICESKGTRKEMCYKFKHIFTAYASQKEVFDHIAYPLLSDLLQGKNGLLFTYGITGSGKTFTLTGEQNNPGIMPRCIDTIFNSIGDFQAPKFIIKSDKMNGFEVQTEDDAMQDRMVEIRSKTRTPKSNRKINAEKSSYCNDGIQIPLLNATNLFAVFVSYIEIYNNNVYDLLDEPNGKTFQNKILREDFQKNMYVNGVVEVEVKSAQEAFELFNAGQKRKKMGWTILNAESSRSHSIFNIRVVQLEQVSWNDNGKPIIPEKNLLTVGQLSLVDLAGSERTNRTQNTGTRLKEASSINNSLMTLRTCMEILRENQHTKGNKMVPYRDSRLTYLFKNYFEGDGRIQMIVCINPSVDDFEENLHVMKFAEMSQDVKIIKSSSKSAVRKIITKNYTPAKGKTAGFTILPDIPICKFDSENMEEIGTYIDKVIQILKQRKAKSKPLDKEIKESSDDFRKRLVDLNQENVMSKTEIRSFKQVINKQRQKTNNLETKIRDLETTNGDLISKQEELQDVIRSLHNIINEKDLKLNQNVLEKEKTKQKIALVSEKMSQELDANLRKQRDHLHAVNRAKEVQLQKVREILNSETIVEPVGTPTRIENTATQTPKSQVADNHHRRNIISSTPRHRRSRSADEVWLEHNSVKPVALGTVLQPTMKRRKSVSKLTKASDITNPKQSKYCLLAQEQDTDGEVETKLYKADIVPTCGGGAQVIFNDVERLRQESPTS